MTPIWLLAAALGTISPAPADTTLGALQAEIAGMVAGFEGDVGAAAIHLESGRGVAVGGEEPFFLASVYKLPIAVALLRSVDAGAVGLGDTVRLAPWDFRIGRATLAPNRPGGSGAYTVGRLLEAMIFDSDNTSSDAILRLARGPAAVNAALGSMGIFDIRIDRSEAETLLEFYGIDPSLPTEERTPARLTARVRASSPTARRAAAERFAAAPGDPGTALALAELLNRLWRGELLSSASTHLLLTHMRNDAIDTRILAGVPPGTPVWHKTGSYAAAAIHEAGVVELPDGTHLAVVVLVRQPARATEADERLIAAITRAAWEFWAVPPPVAEGALSRGAPRNGAEDRR
ncbi:class A beta-lactamase [soil metagenome]